MAHKIWNFGKQSAAMDAAHAKIDPQLTKSNISTILVDGKPVAAFDAPLDEKIGALIAVIPTQAGNHAENELMVTNAQLAAQIEKVTGELATANATVGKLTLDLREASTRAENAENSVISLTAELGQKELQNKASNSEVLRVSKLNADTNAAVSKMCVGVGCIALVAENGGPLAANATEAQKISAADKIPVLEKLTSYSGALNKAIADTGLNVSSLPGAPIKFESGSPNGIRAQYDAITNPTERTNFYRKNKAAIDSSYRE